MIMKKIDRHITKNSTIELYLTLKAFCLDGSGSFLGTHNNSFHYLKCRKYGVLDPCP